MSKRSLSDRIRHLRDRGPRAAAARLKAAVQSQRGEGHVLILHNGRSGSTLLGDMLDQHQDIFWDGETFEKLAHRTAEAEGRGVDHMYGRFTLADGVGEVRERMRTRAGNRIFGSEIQDYHIEMMGTTVGAYIAEMRKLGFTRFVTLDRNYMRKIVSGLVAVDRDSFHVGAGTKVARRKITIDPDRSYIGHRFTSILSTLAQYDRFADGIREALAGDDVLALTYEAHLRDDPQVASRMVCEHIGVEPHAPAIKFGKTTAFPLSDIVENYEEIRALVMDSPYARHMEAAY